MSLIRPKEVVFRIQIKGLALKQDHECGENGRSIRAQNQAGGQIW